MILASATSEGTGLAQLTLEKGQSPPWDKRPKLVSHKLQEAWEQKWRRPCNTSMGRGNPHIHCARWNKSIMQRQEALTRFPKRTGSKFGGGEPQKEPKSLIRALKPSPRITDAWDDPAFLIFRLQSFSKGESETLIPSFLDPSVTKTANPCAKETNVDITVQCPTASRPLLLTAVEARFALCRSCRPLK